MRTGITLLALMAAVAVPAAAAAAPPPNDNRADARAISTPVKVAGTTKDATLEPGERGGCQPLAGSVHYELTATSTDRIVVRLRADGDLDATVEVLRRTRSQLSAVDCATSDSKGLAQLRFRPARGARYLIVVGQRANSVPGTFNLDVFAPQPAARPPGAPLPARGASRTLDSVQDTDDAWSMSLRAGTTYRVNLADGAEGCVTLEIYPPGTDDFDEDEARRTLRCGGYALFTPRSGEGGRYSFRALARERASGPQPYRLQVARAGADDTAPGARLANLRRVRGSLRSAGIDAVDLYRFDLPRRSALRLALGGGKSFELVLLDTRGRRLDSSDEGTLERDTAAGRYFVAVRAEDGAGGAYTLTRHARTITRTSIAIDGRRAARALPGRTVRIGVRVAPRAAGPVTIAIERFDPLAGWQFHRQIATRAANGSAAFAFLPPTTGRWRATARFDGTRVAAPSQAGKATVTVEAPLIAR